MAGHFEALERRALLSGELDTTFGTGGVSTVDLGNAAEAFTRVATGPNNTLYAGGVQNGQFTVARYTPGGTLDNSFGLGGIAQFSVGGGSATSDQVGLVVKPDGSVFIGGTYRWGTDTVPQATIVAFTAGGSLDTNWGGFGYWFDPYSTGGTHLPTLDSLAYDGSSLYAGGDDGASLIVTKLYAGGYTDYTFGTDGVGHHLFFPGTYGTTESADLKLVTLGGVPTLVQGGSFEDGSGARVAIVAGTTLGGGTSAVLPGSTAAAPGGADFSVTRLAIDASGRLLVGGSMGGRAGVVRLTSSGAVDTSFANNGVYTAATLSESTVTSLTALRNGEVVYTGPGGSGSATAGDYVVALTSTGGLNPYFSPESSGYSNEPRTAAAGLLVSPPAGHYYDIAVQADGKLAFAGVNTPFLGASDLRLMRLSVQTAAPATQRITGQTYNDLNRNGIYDGNDVLVSGRRVYDDVNRDGYYTTGEPTTVSGAIGLYSLTLPEGNHTIRQVVPTGYREFSDYYGLQFTTPNPVSTGYNLGAVQQGIVNVTVYLDANQNGLLDAGETFVPGGAQTWVDANNDGIYNEVPSIGTNGAAMVYSLDPGTYPIRWYPRAGYRQTSPAGNGAAIATAVAGGSTSVSIGVTNATPTTGSITGKLFNDFDGNGIQKGTKEVTYTGYGLTAYLDLNLDGALTSGEPTSYTGGTGLFGFAGVAPGSYTLRLNITSATPNISQTWPANNAGIPVTVVAGQTATGAFGVRESAYVYGYAFDDINNNGTQDTGEAGFASRTVFADYNDNGTLDAGEPSAVTNTKGAYSIKTLSGTWRFRQVVPAGFRETARGVTGSASIGNTFAADGRVRVPDDFAAETSVPYFNFGSHALTRVAGFVVRDTNGNGVADTGESALTPGDVVYVDANNNNALDAGETRFTTQVDGWWFSLLPGTYTLRQQLPAGWVQTKPTASAGYTVTVTGTEVNSIYPGNFLRYQSPVAGTASIRGTVYLDENLNEDLDAYEAGSSGRTVFLDTDNDGILDAGEKSTATGTGGAFAFSQLPAGTFNVRAVVPPNMMATNPLAGLTVTLTNGEARTGLLFGQADYRYAVVTGRVFYDENRNSIADGNDYGLFPRDVYVDTNANGYPDDGDRYIASTDPSGNYKLKLPATGGTYKIVFDNVTGWTATTAASYTLTPQPTTGYNGVNFGVGPVAGASAAGVVYRDANKNGKKDAGEIGLANITVYVDLDNDKILDAGERRTVTASTGAYAFTGLPNTGTVTRLRAIIPAGGTQTSPVNGNGYGLTLTANATNTGKDFGVYTPPVTTTGTLSGFTFDDSNKNGTYDAGEAKTSGKIVFLDLDGDNVLDSNEKKTTTGTNGAWGFTGLAAGAYHVRRVFPTGYTLSTTPIDVTLTAGQTLSGLVIGSKSGTTTTDPKTASITGYAFDDKNKNGVYDAGDGLASGKTIWLDLDDDGIKDSGEATVVTGSDGKFAFTGLAARQYHVRRQFPTGYLESTPARYLTLTAGRAASGVYIGSKAK